jgi:hypothetical protein
MLSPTPEKPHGLVALALPTSQDIDNARARREIADRQAQEYGEVLAWAMGAFGPGWLPSHRHYLVEKEEDRVRYGGGRAVPAAVVYTARHGVGRSRHFTVDEGKSSECASYQEGFGSMLLEPHPTRGFQHKGVWCRTHKYSLCWAGYELYHPRSAEQLAALRQSRGAKKAERDEKRFAEDHPLLAWAGITKE